MAIQKLFLRNIGPFVESSIVFDSGINFVIGENAVGKSFCYRSLKACLANDLSLLKRATINKNAINNGLGITQDIEIEIIRDKSLERCAVNAFYENKKVKPHIYKCDLEYSCLFSNLNDTVYDVDKIIKEHHLNNNDILVFYFLVKRYMKTFSNLCNLKPILRNRNGKIVLDIENETFCSGNLKLEIKIIIYFAFAEVLKNKNGFTSLIIEIGHFCPVDILNGLLERIKKVQIIAFCNELFLEKCINENIRKHAQFYRIKYSDQDCVSIISKMNR